MTPYIANAIAEILHKAGFPAGLFQVVHGDFSVGHALCEHPDIVKISLTGGVETGKKILAQSASTLKKVTLELDGKAPLIIFADADFALAVQTALDANFKQQERFAQMPHVFLLKKKSWVNSLKL